ncbi:MAG: glycerophosphodiester phosphodiesterase family protein [Patescibacteria group bacterium]
MLLIAHRGFHDRRIAENTLEAFRRAVMQGADAIEFDLRLSRDGVPVVIHDENLHRVAGDSRRVRDLTAKDLGEVDLRGRGNIPTLNEITAAIPAPTQFDIEVKDRKALQILITKLHTSAALRRRTIISSFVISDLNLAAKEVPDVRTLFLQRTWPLPLRRRAFLKKLTAARVWGVGFPYNILNKRRVTWLRENGFAVAAWDLQSLRRQARRVSNLGVDVGIVYRIDAV